MKTIPEHNRCMVFPEDIGTVTDFDGESLTVAYSAPSGGWRSYLNLAIYRG